MRVGINLLFLFFVLTPLNALALATFMLHQGVPVAERSERQFFARKIIRWGSIDHSPLIPTKSRHLAKAKCFSFFRNELQIFCKRVFEKRKKQFAFMQIASFCLHDDENHNAKRPQFLYHVSARYKVHFCVHPTLCCKATCKVANVASGCPCCRA